MKKASRFTCLLITGLLVCQIGYAGSRESHEAEHQCMGIADQLHYLAVSNRDSVCADDMEVASAYMEAAGNKLYQEKNQEALRLIIQGQRELSKISHAQLYCPQLAYGARIYLEHVITLKNEIAGRPF